MSSPLEHSFHLLHEIDAIQSRYLADLYLKKTEEEKRILQINGQISSKELLLKQCLENKNNLNQKLQLSENRISEKNVILSRLKLNLMQVKTNNELEKINKEIDTTQKEISNLEDESFTYFSNLDELEKVIIECHNYLTGIVETKNEIENEVNHQLQDLSLKKENYQKRLDSLLSELPLAISSLYKNTIKNFKAFDGTAYINNKSCNKCHMAIDQVTITAVLSRNSAELCPNCGRFLLPGHRD